MKGKAKEKEKRGSKLYDNKPISREDDMNNTATLLLLSNTTDNSTIAKVDLLLSSSS